MAAHVFVVPGTLDLLHFHDVVVSTDARDLGGIGSHWWPALGVEQEWRAILNQGVEWLDDLSRYARHDPNSRRGRGPAPSVAPRPTEG